MDIAFKYWWGQERPFLGVQHEEKEKQTFLHFLGRSTSTGQMFSRHQFVQPRIQSCLSRKEISPPYPPPPFMVHYKRYTDGQNFRQAIEGARNLQETTSPSGDENAPSTGNKRMDCIGECHFGLCDAIISSNKTASCYLGCVDIHVYTAHDIPILPHSSWYSHTKRVVECTPAHMQFQDGALLHYTCDVMLIARCGILQT